MTLLERALALIPGASCTNAKSPLRLYPADTPHFANSAKGSRFIDDRGRSWLDCDMALGTVVWGHCRGEIDDAVCRQARRGTVYSIPALLEAEVAARILLRLEEFESVRFLKNGSEAVSAAVRVARSATGHRAIVAGSYHGWHDWAAYHHYGGGTELGIPEAAVGDVRWLRECCFSAVEEAVAGLSSVAAVVACPEEWKPDDLRLLRHLCSSRQAILVFDEVKAGMRFGRRGVFGEIGVVPDLLCLSKGLANGLPLAALFGPRDLMNHCLRAGITTTHAGECISLAAANAAELLLAETSQWPPWRHIARRLMDTALTAINESGLGRSLAIVGYPGCFSFTTVGDPFRHEAFRSHFVRSFATMGVFSRGFILLSAAHSDADVAIISSALRATIESWAATSVANS